MSNKKAKFTPKLVVLSAPSGSGKSTLASMLIETSDAFQLSISYTTRAPRGEEKHGVHYFFVNEKQFKKMVDAGEFLEHALVFGKNWYGTAKSFVDETLKQGKNVLFDIDVQGAHNIKKVYGKQCVSIFIHPPSMEELKQRLRNRNTESPEAIRVRLETARKELKEAHKFDYQLINKDLKETFDELITILKKERCF